MIKFQKWKKKFDPPGSSNKTLSRSGLTNKHDKPGKFVQKSWAICLPEFDHLLKKFIHVATSPMNSASASETGCSGFDSSHFLSWLLSLFLLPITTSRKYQKLCHMLAYRDQCQFITVYAVLYLLRILVHLWQQVAICMQGDSTVKLWPQKVARFSAGASWECTLHLENCINSQDLVLNCEMNTELYISCQQLFSTKSHT